MNKEKHRIIIFITFSAYISCRNAIKLYLKCLWLTKKCLKVYSVFHRFGQAKFAYGGSILSSSQFSVSGSYIKLIKISLSFGYCYNEEVLFKFKIKICIADGHQFI